MIAERMSEPIVSEDNLIRLAGVQTYCNRKEDKPGRQGYGSRQATKERKGAILVRTQGERHMLGREGAVRVEVVRYSRRADGICIVTESSAVTLCYVVEILLFHFV